MRFTTEPLLEHGVSGNLARQDLDRDDPVDDGVVGAPHLTHAASAQQLDQPVVSNDFPRNESLLQHFSELSSLHEKLSRLRDSRDRRRAGGDFSRARPLIASGGTGPRRPPCRSSSDKRILNADDKFDKF